MKVSLLLLVVLVVVTGVVVGDFPTYYISDFGGVPDGVTLNTKAFNAAVTAIATAGGGKLIVTDGVWLSAPFNLTSHMTLYLTHGAVMLATNDTSLWPIVPPLPSYGQGRDHVGPRYTSFIHGEHLEDVVVTGDNGVIDGQGAVWWAMRRNGSEQYNRGSLIEIMYSTDVEISHLTLYNSPFWTVHPYDCVDVNVHDLVIRAPSSSPETDGVDPDSSVNVVIENLDYYGGDDPIAIKSGWDCFGTSYNKPTKNVYIRNLTAAPHNCIAIGSEMSGGVQNVTAVNINCTGNTNGFYIKTEASRGGYVKDITFINVTFASITLTALNIDMFYGAPNPSCPPHQRDVPVINNIHYINITGRAHNRTIPHEQFLEQLNEEERRRGDVLKCTAGAFSAMVESPITNLTVEGVHMQGFARELQPWWCFHTTGYASPDVSPTMLGTTCSDLQE